MTLNRFSTLTAAIALSLTLAACGIGLGLILGGKPVRTSCGAAEGLPGGRCAGCPLRRRAAQAEAGS